MNKVKIYRSAPQTIISGPVTQFRENRRNAGTSQVIYSFTGYPMIKRIVIPASLQKEWEYILEIAPDATSGAFDMVFKHTKIGKELARTLKQLGQGIDGEPLAVHIVGLPKDERGAKLTIQAISRMLGWDENEPRIATVGGPLKPRLDAPKFDNGFAQPLHKDGMNPKTDDAVILYGKELVNNQVPTLFALNEEILYAAARIEAQFRSEGDVHEIDTLLPNVDAPLEEKVTWLRDQLTQASVEFTDRAQQNGVDYMNAHLPEQLPREERTALSNYILGLMARASADHDYTVPICLQGGEALVFNNRALVHARGEGPYSHTDTRSMYRFHIPKNSLATRATDESNIARY